MHAIALEVKLSGLHFQGGDLATKLYASYPEDFSLEVININNQLSLGKAHCLP